MSNNKPTTSVSRNQSSPAEQQIPEWRLQRTTSEPRLTNDDNKNLTSRSAPSSPYMKSKHAKHYRPTGPNYRPVGEEPVIVPVGKRDINKGWRHNESPVTTTNVPRVEEQRSTGPTTLINSTVVLVKQEQQINIKNSAIDTNVLLKEDHSGKQYPEPRRQRRHRGGRRNRNKRPISTDSNVPLKQEHSISSQSSIPCTEAHSESTSTVENNSSQQPKPQQRRRCRRRGGRCNWAKKTSPAKLSSFWWTGSDGQPKLAKFGEFKEPYYAGPSWVAPHPSTLPMPSFWTPLPKINNSPITSVQGPNHIVENESKSTASKSGNESMRTASDSDNYYRSKSFRNEYADNLSDFESNMSDWSSDSNPYGDSSSDSGFSKEDSNESGSNTEAIVRNDAIFLSISDEEVKVIFDTTSIECGCSGSDCTKDLELNHPDPKDPVRTRHRIIDEIRSGTTATACGGVDGSSIISASSRRTTQCLLSKSWNISSTNSS
ncbi:hypothetical protein N431DRAFT_470629 [Stipitochalara longipes BDJ]|nr:hypothetical protein N431DRAFT_470629 [Stipitochalara longipes BDJ]